MNYKRRESFFPKPKLKREAESKGEWGQKNKKGPAWEGNAGHRKGFLSEGSREREERGGGRKGLAWKKSIHLGGGKTIGWRDWNKNNILALGGE